MSENSNEPPAKRKNRGRFRKVDESEYEDSNVSINVSKQIN